MYKHTCHSFIQKSWVNDLNSTLCKVRIAWDDLIDCEKCLEATKNLAKDYILTVELWQRSHGYHELRIVSIGTTINHSNQVGLIKAEVEILIIECVAIDWISAASILESYVTTLKPVVFLNIMEFKTLIVKGKPLVSIAHFTCA